MTKEDLMAYRADMAMFGLYLDGVITEKEYSDYKDNPDTKEQQD